MLRVLIVEDCKEDADFLQENIKWEKLGLVLVGVATNGEEGYLMAEQLKVDIVLTDIVMAKMTGIELIKKCRKHNLKYEFIAMTGYKKFEYAHELLSLGVVDLLVKPINIVNFNIALITAIKKLRECDDIENICRIVDAKDTKNDNFVAKALAYLEKNYKEKLSLTQVANSLYISSWHLCKMFKKYTNRSFVDVLNTIRISKAREFLKSSTLKVNEIARRVGFNDIAYFTVLFKKMTGITPLKYRNSKERQIKMNIDKNDQVDLELAYQSI